MTKEALQERLSRLQIEQKSVEVVYHKYSGAIEECLFWLGQVEEEEKEKGDNG